VSGKLIVAGRELDLGIKLVVKNWHETGWDATRLDCIPTNEDRSPHCEGGQPRPDPGQPLILRTNRFLPRPTLRGAASFEAVQATIKQFVIHADGCRNSEMCFTVLHNERGLSVHFLIDNDGTIYQTLDLALMAFHAESWNVSSIGVELANRGDASAEPRYYRDRGMARETQQCQINGRGILGWAYTKEQIDALTGLCRELRRILPNLPAEYPQSVPGVQRWDTFEDANRMRDSYAGYVGHYHLTAHKWDPGPFDFKALCSRLRGVTSFPLVARDRIADSAALDRTTSELYAATEQLADGGFFPVAPWADSALWHGGVHLVGRAGTEVCAPLAGRIVAARSGSRTPIGSVDFVLVRHDIAIGTQQVKLFSLAMHLGGDADWKHHIPDRPGEVVLVDLPIEAGMRLGEITNIGPAGAAKPQIHIELFCERPIAGPWHVIDGTAGERFCTSRELLGMLGGRADGTITPSALVAAERTSSDALHHVATRHVSEWTLEPDWSVALRAIPGNLSPDVIDKLVAEQTSPGLWWNATVARHCELPEDGVVYHYHPIALLSWLQALELAAPSKVVPITAKIEPVPDTITNDFAGSATWSPADLKDPCDTALSYDDITKGFDAPSCDR
jgi:N-acetyl-anhydromuramyl-L-alanine amidase AmpD